MSAYIGSSQIFGSAWTSPEATNIFSDAATVKRWLRVCEAVASAQGRLGLLSPAIAEATVSACRSVNIDLDRMGSAYQRTGHSLQGFISEFNSQVSSEAQKGFCVGLTVQDVTDTARALALREMNKMICGCLHDIGSAFEKLVTDHGGSLQLGRTHGQWGGLTSFGLKALPFRVDLRHRFIDFERASRRVERIQLAGAVGSLTAFGSKGLDLRQAVAVELGLSVGIGAWTSVRGDLRSYARILQSTSETLAQFANEVVNLSRTEIGEVIESRGPSSVSSITMPHKRNPEVAEQLVALSAVIRAQTETLASAALQEHERDGVGWKLEWFALPLLVGAFHCQARAFQNWMAGLQICRDRMIEHINKSGLTCFFDQILAALGQKIDLNDARALLKTAGELEPLRARELILQTLSSAELDEILSLERNSKVLTVHCRAGLKDLAEES